MRSRREKREQEAPAAVWARSQDQLRITALRQTQAGQVPAPAAVKPMQQAEAQQKQ